MPWTRTVTPSRRRASLAGCPSSSPRRSSSTFSRRASSTAHVAAATTGCSSASAGWPPAATSSRSRAGATCRQRVVFPATAAESHGIEDARLVRFVDEDGGIRYYATYTAFDGSNIAPHLLSTEDFETFSMRPLVGPAAKNKGMALFPRRIGGRFWSLSRWDRESISVASSSRRAALGRPGHRAATEPAMGAHPARRMFVPARDSRGMARHHPRGRPDAHVQPRRRSARPRGPEHRAGRPDRAAHDPGPGRA